MQLTSGQERALQLAQKTQDPLFITGAAGTGKTVVLNRIVEQLRAADQEVVTSAFTGLAALQLKGLTLSRLLGLGLAKRLSDLPDDPYRILERTEANLAGADVLIIDEVSHISGDFLELVEWVLQEALGNERPFGGLRIIFCGDFLQLPPVRGYQDPEFQTKWAFQHPSFREVLSVQLTQSMRQERGIDLQLLNELREGKLTKLAQLFMAAAVNRTVEGAVELYPRNSDVAEINERELARLSGPEQTYQIRYDSDQTREALVKALPIPEKFQLKLGAPVIALVNRPARGYYNGTQGRVVAMQPSQVLIETPEGQRLPVHMHEWKVDLGVEPSSWKRVFGRERRFGSAWGMPLKLGWAATIHKSQGLTLQKVRTDISRCWEPGQAYVALSRATSLLEVSLARPFKKVLADPEALAFTRSLKR